MRIIATIVLVSVSAMVSCDNKPLLPPETKGSTPFYKMSDSERGFLIKAAGELKLGMSKGEVITKFGKPTRELDIAANHVVYFYSQIWHRDLVSENGDLFLRLSFDRENTLKKIQSNIPELSNITTAPLADSNEPAAGSYKNGKGQ